MLLCTVGINLLGNMLSAKAIVSTGYSSKEKGIIKAGYGTKDFQFKKKI